MPRSTHNRMMTQPHLLYYKVANPMKRSVFFCLCSLSVTTLFSSAYAATLTLAAPSDAQLPALEKQLAAWQKKTGHQVKIIKLSNASNDVFVQYRTWLASRNNSVDVYKFDSQWVGQLRRHLLDLSQDTTQQQQMFPTVISAYSDQSGKLYGLPYTVGIPLLYYRKDLLDQYQQPVPKTWTEMTRIASYIQQQERAKGQKNLWGYVFQGAAYEGLTANALEWVASHGGGKIVEVDGSISINNPASIAALTLASSWVGSISPIGVVNYKEDDVRGVFQTGNAVFMRHWPAVWNLLQKESGSAVSGKVAVTRLPYEGQGQSAATMGGWGFVASKYSKQSQLAKQLVIYLGSQEAQRISTAYSLPPTYPTLYDDPALIRQFPLLPQLKLAARDLIARSSAQTGQHYPEVSNEFWTAVQRVLQKRQAAPEAVEQLEQRLKRVKGRGW